MAVMQVVSSSRKIGMPSSSSTSGTIAITQPMLPLPPLAEPAGEIGADAGDRRRRDQHETDQNRGMRVDQRDASAHAGLAGRSVEPHDLEALPHHETGAGQHQ